MMMSSPMIKMCGLKRLEDVELCAAAGVNYLGVIRIVGTPRYKDSRFLEKVIDRAGKQGIHVVGVYQDTQLSFVLEDVHNTGLTHVQLHGEETVEYMEQLHEHAAHPVKICAVRNVLEPPDRLEVAKMAPYISTLLLDLPKGFDGHFNWGAQDFREMRMVCDQLRIQLFLAGKLTPENVSPMVDMHQPHGVDVASGIEGVLGRKDPKLVDAFVHALRG